MKFAAFERTLQGTGASRRLRIAGKVPGIVFGAGEPAMIELDHNALYHAVKKEAFHSTILEMELAGKTEQVLLRDLQMHPFRQLILHVDFQRVDATTKISKKIPLHFVNEDLSPAVKTENCLVNHVVNEVLITCLAKELPEFLEVDLAHLTKGSSLHVNDLKLPAGIKVVTHGKPNPVIASVTSKEEEEALAVAEPAAAAAAAAAAATAAAAAPAKGKKK